MEGKRRKTIFALCLMTAVAITVAVLAIVTAWILFDYRAAVITIVGIDAALVAVDCMIRFDEEKKHDVLENMDTVAYYCPHCDKHFRLFSGFNEKMANGEKCPYCGNEMERVEEVKE